MSELMFKKSSWSVCILCEGEQIYSARGGKVISMHRERLQEILGLSEDDISRLSDCGLILPAPEKPSERPKIDYPRIAHTYREIVQRVRS